MTLEIPLTPLAERYAKLKGLKGVKDGAGVLEQRLREADRLLADPDELAREVKTSIEQSEAFFADHGDLADKPFFEGRPEATREPMPTDDLKHTTSVGKLFRKHPDHRWAVDDDDLSFYYLDREVVVTRAPGLRLLGGRSTKFGPRADLLLANANDGTPIVGELKVAGDKDPFFALIQALACATYLLPPSQLARVKHHDHGRAQITGSVDVYIVLARAADRERSRYWSDLRDRAEKLSEKIAPRVSPRIRRIAGIELVASRDEVGVAVTKTFVHSG